MCKIMHFKLQSFIQVHKLSRAFFIRNFESLKKHTHHVVDIGRRNGVSFISWLL